MNESGSLIVLAGLEGNAPVRMSAMQEFLVPFAPLLERIWWALWFGIVAYMLINYIIVPLIAQAQSRFK